MKRAWIIIEKDNTTFNNYPVGHIIQVGECIPWNNYLENDNYVTTVDFDETGIDLNFLKATLVDDEWVISEDTATKNWQAAQELELAKINWEDACMTGGRTCLVRFNRLLSKYNYGATEKAYFMNDSDFQTMSFLMEHGAINDAIDLLTAKEPVSYYTTEFKAEYLSIISAINTAIGDEPV